MPVEQTNNASSVKSVLQDEIFRLFNTLKDDSVKACHPRDLECQTLMRFTDSESSSYGVSSSSKERKSKEEMFKIGIKKENESLSRNSNNNNNSGSILSRLNSSSGNGSTLQNLGSFFGTGNGTGNGTAKDSLSSGNQSNPFISENGTSEPQNLFKIPFVETIHFDESFENESLEIVFETSGNTNASKSPSFFPNANESLSQFENGTLSGNGTLLGTENGTLLGTGNGTLVMSGNDTLLETGNGTLLGTGNGTLLGTGNGTLLRTGNGTLLRTGNGTLLGTGNETLSNSGNETNKVTKEKKSGLETLPAYPAKGEPTLKTRSDHLPNQESYFSSFFKLFN